MSRLVIAGIGSGTGKTTVTLGLLAALKKRGLKVQPFKVGPDYIDPSLHSAVCGIKSRNLDVWLMPQKFLLETFQRNAVNADMALIEGVMGLYDGVNSASNVGSTAHLARLLKAPVVLVADAQGVGRSCAAIIKGFKQFDKRTQIVGVILNRVGSEKHAEMIKQAIQGTVKIPVLGALPENNDIHMPQRHLGLIPASEYKLVNTQIGKLREFVEANVDVASLINLANQARAINSIPKLREPRRKLPAVRMGIALDEAFSFYYPENQELLAEYGGDLQFFSPLKDSDLPPRVGGLYFGGGFPEVYVAQLAANSSMRQAVRKAVDDGMPVYAECGGLLYLTAEIKTVEGGNYPMVGILGASTVMTTRLQSLGYTSANVRVNNILTTANQRVKGHEFHYTCLEGIPRDVRFAYEMKRGKGIANGWDGWVENNLLASYMHMHFAGRKAVAERFITACKAYLRG